MKLFLCGGGSGKQVKETYDKLGKCIDNKKPVLYIPLAMDENKYDSCKEWFSKEILWFGASNFEMITSVENLEKMNFHKYSMIFIGGGNTYSLLKKIKYGQIMDKIIQYLNEDGIIWGGSAGAIIFGKEIDVCKIEDGNFCDLKDCNGFNYLKNISILCHLNDNNLKKNLKYLCEISYDKKIIYLPEEDTIFIHDKKISAFGDKQYVVIENGKYMYKDINYLKDEFKD